MDRKDKSLEEEERGKKLVILLQYCRYGLDRFFFIFIIVQGLCSRGGIQVRFQGSPEPSVANKGLISVQLYSVPPANEISGPTNGYTNSDEPTSGSAPRAEEGRDVQ